MASEPIILPGPGSDKPPAGESRIHVDTDWKKQAQAEKERLAKEIDAQRQKQAAAEAAKVAGGPATQPGVGPAAGATAQGPAEDLPPATLETLIQTLATQAALFLSEQVDRRTGRPVRDVDLAKHNIDLLRVIEEKTKGNLTPDEKRMLESVLYELLMAYVNAAS